MADQFTFPSGPHRAEIPLWINFSAIPYKRVKTKVEREQNTSTIAKDRTVTVSVPFNGNFTSQNKVRYTDDPMVVLKVMGLGTLTNAKAARIEGLTQLLQTSNTGEVTLNQQMVTSAVAANGNVYMSVDMMDMMFLGGSRRSYSIDFNLICRSPEDSQVAGAICSVLSSKCWPLINDAAGAQGPSNGNAKLMHPDIWAVTLSEQPGKFGDNGKINSLWNDGVGPQICVLTDVNTRRVGGENSRILGINRDFPTSRQTGGSAESTPMPLFYKITLTFTELEPAIQSKYDYSTYSRSRALRELGR